MNYAFLFPVSAVIALGLIISCMCLCRRCNQNAQNNMNRENENEFLINNIV